MLKGIKEGNRITLDTSLVQIPGYTRNSEFPSTGYVRYELADKVGAPPQVIHKTIENINNVKVHTPIYCELFIEEDNLQYVQALEADKEMANAVIGRSDSYGSSGKENISCDFTIRIKTNGNHIGAKGYGLRDYSEYIKVYDVLFPFDVYAEVNGALREEDYLLIPAGTWNPVYNSYYVPEWVQEGVYSVKLRAKAVNADENDSGMQTKANISDIYYITVDEKKIRISGKMYGLTLYSVNSEVSEWRNVFTLSGKIKNTDLEGFKDGTFDSGFDASFRYYYMSGLNNELGLLQTLKNINGQVLSKNEKYRLPLLSGSSPVSPENGMLKSGYVWNFSINTVGSLTAADGARLSVIPSFYWISEDGRSREKVDVWYSAQISGVKYPYVKIGSEADKKNVFSDYASSSAMGIPNTYLRLSVRVRNNRKYYDKNCTLYSYQQILAGSEFKLFTNSEYARIYSRLQKNCSEERLLSLKQTWYFKYSMPDIYHVCKAGYDVEGYLKLNKSLNFGEDFWKKEGYLAVNFDIGVYDDKGKLIMTYLNTVKNHEAGMCNMWELEGFEKNRYNAGTEMKLEYGDVIVLRLPGTTKDFQSGKPDPATNKSEDYIVDHLN